MTEALVLAKLQRQADRVRDHSPQHVNRRIARNIDMSVQHYTREGREAILARLTELDREWDIDRVVMANFAIGGGITYLLGLRRFAEHSPFGRRPTGLLYLFGTQLAFLLLHASAGWCPPVAVWRRLGVRTKSEIELERSLLLQALEPPLTSRESKAVLERVPESQGPRSSQIVS